MMAVIWAEAFLFFAILASGTKYSFGVSIQRDNSLPVIGEDFTLICNFTPQAGYWVVTWMVGDDVTLATHSCHPFPTCWTSISNPSKFSFLVDSSSGNLTIKDLINDDSGSYQCAVSGINGTAEKRSSRTRVTPLLQVPPKNLLLSSPAETRINEGGLRVFFVHENRSTSFTCISIGSRPEATISWELGNTDISPRDITYMDALDRSLYDTESTIKISPQRKSHTQFLRCSASFGVTVFQQREAMLVVYGPPNYVKLLLPAHMKDGLPTKVICRAYSGYPAPSFNWYIESRKTTIDYLSLRASVHVGDLLKAESILTFSPLRSDHGKYVLCEATYPTATSIWSRNTSAILNILYKPVVHLSVRRQLTNKQVATLIFKCTSDANPPANDFIWSCNYTTIHNNTNNKIIYKPIPTSETLTTSEMVTHVTEPDDSCHYRCLAFTRVGSGEAVFNSKVSTFPDPPQVTVDQNFTTSSSLHVVWQPSFDGKLWKTFSLDFCTNITNDTLGQEEECSQVMNLTGSSVELTGLKPFTWYRVTFWAVSSSGESTLSTILETTASTAPLPPKGYGMNVTLNRLTGILAFSKANADQTLEGTCFIILNTTSGMSGSDCSIKEGAECVEPGAEVKIDLGTTYHVVTYGRGLCSQPESPIVVEKMLKTSHFIVFIDYYITAGALVFTVFSSCCVFCLVKNMKARSMGAPKTTNISVVQVSTPPAQPIYDHPAEELKPPHQKADTSRYMTMKTISNKSPINWIDSTGKDLDDYVLPTSTGEAEEVYENMGKIWPY